MLRFAQSPTYDMYIGDLRVAILNYLIAQQQQKPFTIRIDDTDKASNIEGKDTEIMQILEKFALIHESVFHQSEHLHMHQTLAIKLLEEDKAFICTCTPETLEADKKEAKESNIDYCYSGRCENRDKSEHAKLKESNTPFVLRLKKPAEPIMNHDLILGDISTTPNKVDSFIILTTEGTPTENFASACDDMLSGTTTIISEDDYILDTAKQIHIKKQLGFDADIDYAHIPVISNANDDSTVKWLFEQGYVPDAIINYLLLLGYNEAPKEIFTLPEAIEWFKLENISKSTAKFDKEKLKFINREHLKMVEDKQLSSLFGFADADVGKLIKLYLKEVSTINALASKIRPIFAPKVFEGKWKKEMEIMQKIIANAPMINSYDEFKSYMSKESGLKEDNLLKPLRLLLTGAEDGPELCEIYPFIKAYLLEVAS